jgi:hypothetical protein
MPPLAANLSTVNARNGTTMMYIPFDFSVLQNAKLSLHSLHALPSRFYCNFRGYYLRLINHFLLSKWNIIGPTILY